VPKSTDARIVAVRATTETVRYRSPIKFGGRVVTDAQLLHVTAEVETRDGRRGQGQGSMPLGNVWAWPSAALSTTQTLEAMAALAGRLVAEADRSELTGHPLGLTRELAQTHSATAQEIAQDAGLSEPIPKLAQLVSTSQMEAALHDAYGKAHGRNAYDLLGADFVNADLGHYLSPDFAGEYLDRYTLRHPRPRMPLYHLVGALDPLSSGDVQTPVNDGLPETLSQWISADGLTHIKIKLAGDNLAWDVNRVIAVEQVAAQAQRQRGCTAWNYSLDFNEKCENVAYVLDFLAQLESRSPAAFRRVQYIEQPTHRDLRAHPENRMHAAAHIKPVVIDESLLDLDSLMLCRELGYTGVALKACKGHTEALLMGAAAQKYGMFLCVQDLTCPGRSFLHSASLAARMPTVAAIEGNARQYCPDGNRDCSERFPTMFHITDGSVGTSVLDGPGIGYG
jgi:L-alanine-DL-glutamate epimerase-like enolase superfamily enzyme